MPGRTASGGLRVAGKTTSTKSASRARTGSPANEIPDEGKDTSLRSAICTVFADSQKSTAGHRKAVISLRKIQEACCYEPVSEKQGRKSEDFDEDDFNTEIIRCTLRILPVKKAEPAGDRIVRFLGTFLNVASTKDNEIAQQDDDSNATHLPETPTSRLTSQLLGTLLPLLQAREKTIRFRATQITSHIINSLDTLEDNLFHQLRLALLKRIHDKEAPVRMQAVYGLGRLAAEVENDDENQDSDSDDEASGVLQKLLVVLQHDPSAEVRRNLLLNLPLTKEVLPYLLERARDADASTRRALYARLLPALGDFRLLGLTHREKILRWGLRDRDESVRKATARLFSERWIEDCAALPAQQSADQVAEGGDGEEAKKAASQAAVPSLDALLELLERIDVVNSGLEDGIALTAMEEFWQARPDYVQYVSFPDTFWDDLNPELAFVARTYNDHCRKGHLDDIIEEKLPEVTKFGFLLEREVKRLIEMTIEVATGDENPDAEAALAHLEFIVEQMLHMALTFDYSDEVGRRKMYYLLREMLGKPDLPEEVTRLVVENLRLNCGEGPKSEGHFCSVVMECIAEVHDTILGEDDESEPDSSSVNESFHSATSHFDGEDDDTIAVAQRKAKKLGRKPVAHDLDPEAEQQREIREFMVNMKCLHIALCTLQNIQCDLVEDANLVTMLDSLIVPAVRDQRPQVRERGMLCLGLCCLLTKKIASENLALFMHCFRKGRPELQAIVLQIITDVIISHPSLLSEGDTSTTDEASPGEMLKPVIKMYKDAIRSEDPTVQATGAIALSKAMLSRLITDTGLLQQLVVVYFDPDTNNNAQLRQSLNYFLPVYCHSNVKNVEYMVDVSCGVINKLFTLKDAFEHEDVETSIGDEMVKISKAAEMLIDWTDPRKIVGANNTDPHSSAGETHFQLAEAILERLVTSSNTNKDERKVLLSMLGKLHLAPSSCGTERLMSVLELLTEAMESKVAVDKTSTETLKKLHTALLSLVRDAATAERGGEETILETTEMDNTIRPATISPDEDDDVDDEDSDVTQLQREMRDSTIGAITEGFTTGLPDAEGTRIQLGVEDEDLYTEMMDVDD